MACRHRSCHAAPRQAQAAQPRVVLAGRQNPHAYLGRQRLRACQALTHDQNAELWLGRQFKALAGVAAALAVLGSLAPSASALDTVPAGQVTQLARPLPKPQQPVNKGQVWAVCVGGAAALFVGTVVAENNEAWFPAISRANKAMAINRQQQVAAEAAARRMAQEE